MGTLIKFVFDIIFGLFSWYAIFFSTAIAGLASLNYIKTISANPIPEIADTLFTICVFVTAINISTFICKKMYFS